MSAKKSEASTAEIIAALDGDHDALNKVRGRTGGNWMRTAEGDVAAFRLAELEEERDVWRILATRLACALESVLDSPTSEKAIEEANAALDDRLAYEMPDMTDALRKRATR